MKNAKPPGDLPRKEYEEVLMSGLFWEWFPTLTGNWKLDEGEYREEFPRYYLFKKKYNIAENKELEEIKKQNKKNKKSLKKKKNEIKGE